MTEHIYDCTPLDARIFGCIDCGVCTNCNGEYYMVNDEVWLGANPKGRGMLCIGCLEDRLGRLLTKDDFNGDAPVNSMWLTVGSTRLKNRLTLETNHATL
jgi:hypothetical protein